MNLVGTLSLSTAHRTVEEALGRDRSEARMALKQDQCCSIGGVGEAISAFTPDRSLPRAHRSRQGLASFFTNRRRDNRRYAASRSR